MDIKQIQELVKLINKTNIGEITIEEDGIKITIKQKKGSVRKKYIPVAVVPYSPPPPPLAACACSRSCCTCCPG